MLVVGRVRDVVGETVQGVLGVRSTIEAIREGSGNRERRDTLPICREKTIIGYEGV